MDEAIPLVLTERERVVVLLWLGRIVPVPTAVVAQIARDAAGRSGSLPSPSR